MLQVFEDRELGNLVEPLEDRISDVIRDFYSAL